MKIEFTAFGIAKPAGSKTGFVMTNKQTGKQRAVVVDACKTTKPWQAVVRSAAYDAMEPERELGNVCPLAAPLIASFRFYFPRPKSHYNSKGELKPSAPAFITKRPDVLKLSRAVEDAMSMVVYFDDSQIVQEHLFKSYGEPARCEVKIETLTPTEDK